MSGFQPVRPPTSGMLGFGPKRPGGASPAAATKPHTPVGHRGLTRCPRCQDLAPRLYRSPAGIEHCGCLPLETEGVVEFHPEARPQDGPAPGRRGVKRATETPPSPQPPNRPVGGSKSPATGSSPSPDEEARDLVCAWRASGGGVGALESAIAASLRRRIEADAREMILCASVARSEGTRSSELSAGAFEHGARVLRALSGR